MDIQKTRIRYLLSAAFALAGSSVAATAAAQVSLISATSAGTSANSYSSGGQSSDDGRYVMFKSSASNLVAGDGNGQEDIFVRDTQTNAIERVTVSLSGGDPNGGSPSAGMSGDGRFIAFTSFATNLVPGTLTGRNVFIRDRLAGTTERVPIDPLISGSGPDLTFSLSTDGRYLLLQSLSHEVVPGQLGGYLYRYDRVTHDVDLVDVSSSWAPSNSYAPRSAHITGNGRYVVFDAADSDLAPGDANENPNGGYDIFVRDLLNETTQRVSLDSLGNPMTGESSQADISDDGRIVAFVAQDQYGTQTRLYVRDLQAGITERLELPPTTSGYPALIRLLLSGDGSRIAYAIETFPPGGAGLKGLFVYDRNSKESVQINLTPGGAQAAGTLTLSGINRNGRLVNFTSSSSTLVANDANGYIDAFRGVAPLQTRWHSHQVALSSSSPQASVTSSDGRTAAIEFYESTNAGGVEQDFAFGSYTGAAHAQGFNKIAPGFLSAGGLYPYAGKSAIERGTDTNESLAPSPLGVRDLQLHPPANSHLTVAAFVAPEPGRYFVSGLAARRASANGQSISLHLFAPTGSELASLQTAPSQNLTWVTSPQNYDLGTLQAGDRIYFGVSADGDYSFDATEIAWDIALNDAPPPAQQQRVWNSYDSDNALPVDYFESNAGYPAATRPFTASFGAHPEEFNRLGSFVTPSSSELYPYAGRSNQERGNTAPELNAPSPFPSGVSDMQLHPPEGPGSTVAAFHVPQTGAYTLSDLAVRRVDHHGDAVTMNVYAHGDLIATLGAYNDRKWVMDAQTYNLGTLQAGDTIYFAVNSAGDYAFDATEIAWKIRATLSP